MVFTEIKHDVLTPLMLIFFVVVGLFFALFRSEVLPEKYSNDSSVYEYESTKVYEGGFVLGDSKENTNRLYSYIGVTGDLDDDISGAIFSIFVLLFFLPILYFRFGLYTAFLVGVWYLISCIYTIQYTKEHLAMVVTVIMFLLASRGGALFLPYFALVLIYAIYFRPYWVVFGGAILYFQFVLFKFHSRKIVLMLFSLGLVFMTFVLSYMFDGELSNIRFRMNEERIGTGLANSAILPLLDGSGYLKDCINALASVVELVFPVRLIMKGSLVYFIFSAFQIIFLYIFFKACLSRLDNISRLAISFIVAYVYVQALFVPDYGAYLRHYMVVVPISLFAILRATADIKT